MTILTIPRLRFSGGKASPAIGDPGLWYDETVVRAAGQICLAYFNTDNITGQFYFGYFSAQSGACLNGIHLSNADLLIRDSSTLSELGLVAGIAAGIDYGLAVVQGATQGQHYFVKIDGNWLYMGYWGTDTTTPTYVGISNYSAAFYMDNFIVPSSKWLPKPIASDTFTTPVTAVPDLGSAGDAVGKGLAVDSLGTYFNNHNLLSAGGDAAINLYSSGLESKFDGSEGGAIIRARVPADIAPVNSLHLLRIQGNDNPGVNIVEFYWNAGQAGIVNMRRYGNGTAQSGNVSSIGASWFVAGITWSEAGDTQDYYKNGATSLTSDTAIGAWTGTTLNNNRTCLGAHTYSTVGGGFYGWISDVVLSLNGVVPSSGDHAAIAAALAAGTLTAAQLNTLWGSGNWAWWRLNQTRISDGAAHNQSGSLGAGGNAAVWLNSTFRISGGTALGYPADSYGDLVPDGGDMEGNPAAAWTADNSATLTNLAEERTGGTGVQSLKIARSTVNNPAAALYFTPELGEWLVMDGWHRKIDCSYTRLRVRDATAGEYNGTNNTTTTWTYGAISYGIESATGCSAKIQAITSTGTQAGACDDIRVRSLHIKDCISVIDAGVSDFVMSVKLTIPYQTFCGLVFCLDDRENPDNYYVVAHSGSVLNRVNLYKCVDRAFSLAAQYTGTYSAGAAIRVIKIQDRIAIYYNSDYLGSVVAEAALTNNTQHGIFSTFASNVLDDFILYAGGGSGEYNSVLNQFGG